MYKVVINKGLGFTEITKEFENITEACDYSLEFDNVKIYKGKIRLF